MRGDKEGLPRAVIIITLRAHAQQGVKQSCWSVCLSVDKNIDNTNNQLKCAIIRSEKGTITTFEFFFDSHSTDSMIYNLLELQMQSFLLS